MEVGTIQEADVFDIALDDTFEANILAKPPKNHIDGRTANKRMKKDNKFGYGGRKRFSKSGDAASSADIRSFSLQSMKGRKKGAQRLGKGRRAKQQ